MMFSACKRLLSKGGRFQCFTSPLYARPQDVRRSASLVCVSPRLFSCENSSPSSCTEAIPKAKLVDPGFSLRPVGNDKSNNAVFKSPEILTVRRNASLFRVSRRLSSSISSCTEAVPKVKLIVPRFILRPVGNGKPAITDSKNAKISILAHRYADSLNLSPQTTLANLEFLSSIGLTIADLVNIIVRYPRVLAGSLDNKLIPCYNFLKNLPLPDEEIIKVIKHYPNILRTDVGTILAPNVELLRSMSVPEPNVISMVTYKTHSVVRNHGKFKSAADHVVKLGLDPLEGSRFCRGVHVILEMQKRTWDRKMECRGLSEDKICSAFRKEARLMALSNKGIEKFLFPQRAKPRNRRSRRWRIRQYLSPSWACSHVALSRGNV